MKTLHPFCSLLMAFLLCFICSDLFAAEWHVKPSAEVPVRRGQSTEYKIIAVVGNGTTVELLEENEGWAKIRLDNNKEGWILKRYLSKEKPMADQVQELKQKNTLLEQQLTATDTQLTELIQVHSQTEQDLTSCLGERDSTKAEFQQLQQETADVIQTKKKLEATEKECETLKKSLTDLQFENTSLKKNSALLWFLAGGGILLTGWLIGLFTGRKTKKRRGSLL